MFNRTMTFFHGVDGGCEKHIIQDIFFDATRGLSLESKGETEATSIKVVIPITPALGGYEPQEGDYVCKGVIEDDYDSLTSMKQAQDSAHLIISCDKRDYGSNPHYLILGK